MVAISFVLSLIPVFELPWGGSATCFSTLPIIMMSLRHGGKWGVATAAVYSITQMLQGTDSLSAAMAATNVLGLVGCALIDYLMG